MKGAAPSARQERRWSEILNASCLEARVAAGAADPELATAREMKRRAQLYIDFAEAENSTGFHAPQEATRILGEALDYARQGQLALRDPAYEVRIAPPTR